MAMFELRTPDRAALPYLRVGIVLCPGFTLTPMASFVDALRLAADRQDRSRQIYFAWDFIPAGPPVVRSSCGLEVKADGTLDDPNDYDCVVVCGGLLCEMEAIPPELHGYLRAADARGIPIVGLCTGSFVLAQAGLLTGRRCALHFDTLSSFLERFDESTPDTGRNYVIDGNIITCPGSIVAIDVASLLIEFYSDRARAQKSLNYLLFKPEEERIALRRAPYQEALGRASRLVVDAVKAMETRVDAPCSVEDLARLLGTSKTNLNRSFMRDLQASPAAFWRKLRLLAARELLANRRRTVTEIAYETGFSDTSHFCNLFKQHFAISPQAFRHLASSGGGDRSGGGSRPEKRSAGQERAGNEAEPRHPRRRKAK